MLKKVRGGFVRPAVAPFLARLVGVLIGASLIAGIAAPATAQSPTQVTVTDLAGRTVSVTRGAPHVILGEGRELYDLAVLDRANPFARIAAWGDDLKSNDPDTWRKYLAKYPDAAKIPNLGNPYVTDFNVETMVAANPDVVILDLGNYFKATQTGLLDKLAKIHIPVVFIDTREDPSQNTLPSILLLGRILDRDKEAQEFADFYQQQTRLVYARVGNLQEKDKPLVFMERAAGYDPNTCCTTWGPVNFGKFVDEAGGRNWGSKLFSGAGGDVSPEKIIADDPDFYFLTGANWAESTPATTAVLLGYEATPDKVQQRLLALMQRPGLAQLTATKKKKVMVLYHQFYDSPYSFVAVQAMAKFLHPDLFKDIDPEATWEELHKRFLPVTPSGIFWATLQ